MRDEQFIRGKIPMTKSEVRAVSLSKFELRTDGVFYDIGAGTGSVSVEAALMMPAGHVYAIEQKAEGCALIRANCDKFGIHNIRILEGGAPDCLAQLPAPDYVFIGGSGKRFPEIMAVLEAKNPAAKIVINVIALETLAQITGWLKENNKKAEIVLVQISKARQVADYHLMEGNNPVYVISVEGTDDQ